jgi:carboxypeptidase family protein
MARGLPAIAFVLALACGVFAQQSFDSPDHTVLLAQDRPTRDTPAQKDAVRPPAGRITGRVVAADNGRPVKRARVFVSAIELPGGRGMLTDDNGVFDFTELPAGRYTLTVSKTGFVALSYGQRRPLQAGTPLQLTEDQQLKGIQFQLPRGSVIGGRVLDEDGDAMPGVMVRVMRYQYQQGERRLTPAGTAQTDDRGQYRVWGLMPGDYYVNAVMRGGNFGGFAGPAAFAGRGGGRGFPGGPGGGGEQDQTNYAPTYYPGVPSVNEAKPITVGLSQEVLDINFGMQLVKIARITGHVANPDGTMVTSGNVNLVPENAGGRGAQIGVNFGGRIEWDGAFAITSVPPGRYVLRARANDSDTPLFATQPISLNGENVPDLSVVLSAGASVTGAVTFLPGQTPLPDPTQVRLSAPSTDQSDFGQQSNARVDKEGRFALNGVSAGSHLIRAAGNMRGWMLKSVTIGGRDVTDTPVALRSGETLANVVVVFTDRLNEVNGTVTDEGGAAVPDFTVLAFPTDATLWRPQARQIMTARPDQTGQYRIRGLPPGEYYLVTVDPTEQGEWFEPAYLDDHRAGAARVTLGDGDLETHDFKVRR